MLIARGTANYTAMDHCLDGPQRSMREDRAHRKKRKSALRPGTILICSFFRAFRLRRRESNSNR